MQFYSNAKKWLPSSLKFSMQPGPLEDQSSALELQLTHYTYLKPEKFEYDSRLKADLIKIVNLNSTYLNFHYYFKLGQAEPS